MKTVRILTIDNVVEAHLLKARLENEGIECFLTNENFTNLLPLYNHMMGAGVQLIVSEKDETQARQVLSDKISPNNEELICPNCGSNEIKLRLGKNKLLKIINIFLSLLIFVPFGNTNIKYVCKHCKTEIK